MCGDLNAHHVSYGCSFNDIEGNELLDAIHDENLCILNDGTPTLIARPDRQPSAPDLSICSPSLLTKCEWSVLNEPFGSDHLGLLITINNNNTDCFGLIKRNRKWNIKLANWEKYALLSDQLLNELQLGEDPIANYKQFVNALNQAASQSIPELKPYKGRKLSNSTKPWWDGDCDQMKKKYTEAYSIYKNSPTWDNFINYKRVMAQCRRVYKKKKKEKWSEFCCSFNKNTPIKEIWRRIRSLSHGHHRLSPSSYEWIPEFLNSVTPEIVAPQYSLPDTSTNPHKLNGPFLFSELISAIKTNRNTSPGGDMIHYPMLSELSTFGKQRFLRILNDIWSKEVCIEDWNRHLVVPLLKPKKDPDQYQSYRPIALTSCIGKTFERLVKARLEWWLESERKLPEWQHGFRKKCSTLDALSNFVMEIHGAFSEQKILLAANLDLSNAYSHVDVPILIQKMIDMGSPTRIVHHVHHLLSTRFTTINYNGKLYGPRRSSLGLPQGAVLSPILFNIYTAQLGHILGPDVHVSQFADDIIIFCQKKTLEQAIDSLDISMSKFGAWSTNIGFTLSEEKSSVTVFTRRRDTTVPSSVRFGSYQLRVVPEMKTLGMVIDRKMLWRTQIENIIKKCKQTLNVLRYINHVRYGADICTSLKIFKQLVLSRMDYGCFLYGDAADAYLKKIEKIQYKALRCCLGALNSTPTNALLAEAKVQPLAIRRKLLGSRFIIDRLAIKNQTLIERFNRILRKITTGKFWSKTKVPMLVNQYRNLSQYSSHLIRYDTLPVYNFDISYQTLNSKNVHLDFFHYDPKLPNFVNNALFLDKLDQKFPNSLQLYTDGSKDSQGVGCAVYDAQSKRCMKYKLHPLSSIFTAELFALHRSLLYVRSVKHPLIVILSDSKSVLYKLKCPGTNPPSLILETVQLMKDMQNRGKTIHLIWIKGHMELGGNEIADKKAKEATKLNNPAAPNSLLLSDIKSLVKRNCYNEWQQKYDLDKMIKGKYYTAIQPGIPIIPWFSKYNTTHRKFHTVISRLRFNHNYSPHHLAKIGVNIDPYCSCSPDNSILANSNHLILECPKYDQGRDQLWSCGERSSIRDVLCPPTCTR